MQDQDLAFKYGSGLSWSDVVQILKDKTSPSPQQPWGQPTYCSRWKIAIQTQDGQGPVSGFVLPYMNAGKALFLFAVPNCDNNTWSLDELSYSVLSSEVSTA